MNEALVVLTTVETTEDGERLARVIIERELAACVQMLPPMTSIYRWQGKIEQASEALLLVKTTRAAYPELELVIRQNHSYQTPEIIALPVGPGSKDYLDWLTASVRHNSANVN
ncbi:MAG: divalent-cation tolerance protein CutA [Acidobacteria bacterium]|nr:divalent-cation tolerance protein CutA [Acidobacteriota bacterium]MCI0663849.1 divalent-cation tolerance protein CutA [Acidobacteriota bacterium]